jgi:hypothetical protein
MTQSFEFDPARVPLPPDEELWGTLADEVAPSDAPSAETDALDARLRALLQADAAPTVPRDAMWDAIRARRTERAETVAVVPARSRSEAHRDLSVRAIPRRLAPRPWPLLSALAATLAVGVAIGRVVDTMPERARETRAVVAAVSSEEPFVDSDARATLLAHFTAEHLSRTEALLVTTRTGTGVSSDGDALARWARDLLATTRLLLDAEPAQSPPMQRLLQDLELTLALILQAQASGRPDDLQAVRADLDDGDLLLRVRSASTDPRGSITALPELSE